MMIGWGGSGTAAVVLDAAEDSVAFSGIAMAFSPPQDHGMDANAILADLEAPIFFVGSNAGVSASWSRRMSNRAQDWRGAFVFERVPTGLQFNDVFGPELIGRLLEFADSVA